MTAVELDAWYVYGVVSAGAKAPDGVTLVERGPVAAAVAPVSLSDFGEDALAAHLNDRDWLEQHAREHEDVLRRVAASTNVVPFRFGAIYRDRADVESLLDARRDELVAALERVRGRIELGVKVWADRARIEAAADDAAPASTGRAYLERRLEQQDRAQRISSLLADTARTVHARLLAHAIEGVANRPQPRELTGREEPMILNGAYLVPVDDDSFGGEVGALRAEHADDGITVELTGPWPPYNFVASEVSE